MTLTLSMAATCLTVRRHMHSRRPDSLTLLRTCKTYGPRSGMPAGLGIDVTGYTPRFLLAPL